MGNPWEKSKKQKQKQNRKTKRLSTYESWVFQGFRWCAICQAGEDRQGAKEDIITGWRHRDLTISFEFLDPAMLHATSDFPHL